MWQVRGMDRYYSDTIDFAIKLKNSHPEMLNAFADFLMIVLLITENKTYHPIPDRCFDLLIQEPSIAYGINSRDEDNRTPLHMAAIYGRLSRSKALIDNQAEVNTVDDKGQTPLHVAAAHGHELLVGLLLSAGMKIYKL